MTTLAAPNATAAERALERASVRLLDVPVPLAKLWNPDTCPIGHLPWLAWAVSVDVWDDQWTETEKRQVIRDSVQVHRLKGTRSSIETALAGLGFRIDISEWFENGGAPHTFLLEAFAEDVFAAGLQVDARLLSTVRKVIDATKPVRSHFELRIGETRSAEAWMQSGVRIHQRVSEEFYPGSKIVTGGPPVYARSGFLSRQISSGTHLFPVTEGAAYAA